MGLINKVDMVCLSPVGYGTWDIYVLKLFLFPSCYKVNFMSTAYRVIIAVLTFPHCHKTSAAQF